MLSFFPSCANSSSPFSSSSFANNNSFLSSSSPSISLNNFTRRGAVDRDEVAELMKTFNKLAHKGKLTKESIKSAMKKTYGDSYDAAFSNLLFNLFDKDGSKYVFPSFFFLPDLNFSFLVLVSAPFQSLKCF